MLSVIPVFSSHVYRYPERLDSPFVPMYVAVIWVIHNFSAFSSFHRYLEGRTVSLFFKVLRYLLPRLSLGRMGRAEYDSMTHL